MVAPFLTSFWLRWPPGHVGVGIGGPRPRSIATSSREIPRIDDVWLSSAQSPALRWRHGVEPPSGRGFGRPARIGVVERVSHDLIARMLI
jgi:hypothetical protein